MNGDPFLLLNPGLIKFVLGELLSTASLLPALLALPDPNNVFETYKASILSGFIGKYVHPSILLDTVTAVSPLVNECKIQARAQEYE